MFFNTFFSAEQSYITKAIYNFLKYNIQKIHMKAKLIVLFLCLVSVAWTQTECVESRLDLLQTGQVILNPNDLGTAGSNKIYYESLSRGSFGKSDYLGFAFALAGFQTTCTQSFYSLFVDVVEFQYANTQMRIVINFLNKAGTTLTVWTKVKLSYIVVSAARKIAGHPESQIWATSQMVDLPSAIASAAILKSDLFSALGTINQCGLQWDSANSKWVYYISCGPTTAAAGPTNDIAVHAYIMGFQYQTGTASSSFIGAQAKFGINAVYASSGMIADTGIQLIGQDINAAVRRSTVASTATATAAAVVQRYGVAATNTAVGGATGPYFNLDNFGGELKAIKVGIVLSMVNPGFGDNAKRNGFQAVGSYSYSGLYTPVATTTYNIRTMIDDDSTKNWNNLHEKIPVAKYKIYGLTSFKIADGTGCTSFNIDVNINTQDSYTVTLNNAASVTQVIISADMYFPLMSRVCSPIAQFNSLKFSYATTAATATGTSRSSPFLGTYSAQTLAARAGTNANLKQLKTRLSEKYSTVPSSSVNQRIQQITTSANPLDLQFIVNGVDGDTTTVKLNAAVNITGITDGKPYGVRILMIPDSTRTVAPLDVFDTPLNNLNYEFSIKVNGLPLYVKSFTKIELDKYQANAFTTLLYATQTLSQVVSQQFYGVNLKGTTALFQYALSIPRSNLSTVSYAFTFEVEIYQFGLVFDPSTQCCTPKCPNLNGLDVSVTPPACMACDLSKGLTYDPVNATCKCADGFYFNSLLGSQCFQCLSKLCAVCPANATSICTTCLTGATLNPLSNDCSCSAGYFEDNGKCTKCAAKCATCKVAGTCDTCADTNRVFANGCACITGFYDAGVDKCVACNPSCAACTNATSCSTCDGRLFRTFKDGLCVCQDGFFQLINTDGTKVCKPCSAQCQTCRESASQCITCDGGINRIQGFDSLGHQTCICKSGYHSLPDSSCIQSNCNSDKWCSACEKDLALCIQCRASVNRVIKLPEHTCVCADGYYQDALGNCTACSSGCAVCSSAKNCTSCVAGATQNSVPTSDGTCNCKVGTFFGISVNGVRYCQQCIQYCDACSNELTCNKCQSGFVLSIDNTCICPPTNFIDQSGKCVPCKSGCETCLTAATCNKCVTPLVVQQNNCVAKCTDGYFLSGAVCQGCPKNCQACTANNQCFYCRDTFYLSGGACYSACPSGSVANKDTMKCVACNPPCRTCTSHPSSCTSCQPGEGYLQITANDQRCVKECAEGTFPKDNVCQVCDFRCAKCLGASNNCIACPAGRFLYNGACWDSCPGILANNNCVNICPAGFFRFSDQQCRPCSQECSTCSDNSTCLTCANNYLSRNGKCVTECGDGYYTFRGICVACDKSCKSCKSNPTQCVECASGFVNSGAKCVSSCETGTFLDAVTRTCKPCASTCKTCVSDAFCTTCPNPNILPVGGQCLPCKYPCDTCSSDLSVCNSCLSGFVLSNGQCLGTCPSGTVAVNKVCSCQSGIFLDGACVASCPSGYTKVGQNCQRCQSPCTQCSGSISTCTDCLDSYTLRPTTGTCEQNSACNFGQYDSNGKCLRICVEGSYYQSGACIFGGCPATFKDNGFGGCVNSLTNTGFCNSPTFKLNSNCVSDCGDGFFPNTNSRNCDACPSNCQNCLNNNFCLTCSNGFTVIDGRCTANSNCPANQFFNNGVCVDSCPNGSFTSNGRCTRSCPSGSYYFGGWCYDTCPDSARFFTDNACVAVCPAGTRLVDVVCTTLL